jgi:hypothetical protein
MACSDEDRGRSRRSGVEDRGWSHRSGGTVCSLHRARGDEERDFLAGPQNQGRWFVSGLASKSLGQFLIGLALKTDGDSL